MFLLWPLAMQTADVSALTSWYVDGRCFSSGLLLYRQLTSLPQSLAMQTADISAPASCYADSWHLCSGLLLRPADVSALVSYYADSWHFCSGLLLCRQLMCLFWPLAMQTADVSLVPCYADSWHLLWTLAMQIAEISALTSCYADTETADVSDLVSCYADSWCFCSSLLLRPADVSALVSCYADSWHLCSGLLLRPADVSAPSSYYADSYNLLSSHFYQQVFGQPRETVAQGKNTPFQRPSSARSSVVTPWMSDCYLLGFAPAPWDFFWVQFCAHSTKALEMRL